MIKRFIGAVLIFCLSVMQIPVFASVSFPDIKSDHWAYSSVIMLVENGTISGYEDGEFKPDNIVLRSEFVKMIGKGNNIYSNAFNDVPQTHWAYDYIMSSGLKGDKFGNFNPDKPITRGDVLELIWERAGSKEGVLAPSVVTNQHPNKNAAAWVYQYGIMIGNDGVNLRLEDTLSRAEAATLIVRSGNINESSKQINFIDVVSPKLLETIFKSSKLFDDLEYDPSKTITNGEMARGALRLGYEEFVLSYKQYSTAAPFEHQYAKDLWVIGNYCLGKDIVTKDLIDKNANIQDTLAALTYGAIIKSHAPLSYNRKDNYYTDASNPQTNIVNSMLTFAKQNGISLYADGRINAKNDITKKEVAAIILQLDGLIGTQTSVSTQINEQAKENIKYNQKILNNLDLYPQNADNFQCILSDIPRDVYQTPYSIMGNNSALPKQSYDFTREFGYIFSSMLINYKQSLKTASNVSAEFTYYPSLACNNGNGFTLRVKCEIISTPENTFIKTAFKTNENVSADEKLYNGMTFFADIVTGQSVSSVEISDSSVVLDKIIYKIK